MTDVLDPLPGEADLRARLDRLAATIPVDPEAREEIQRRIDARRRARRPSTRRAVAVAAAVALVAVAVAVLRHHEGTPVKTSDSTTTTRATTTTRPDRRTTSISPPTTAAPLGGAPLPPGGQPGAVPGAGGVPAGPSTGAGSSTAPGGGTGASSGGSGAPAPTASGGGGAPAPPPGALPDGRLPAVTFDTGTGVLQATAFESEGTYYLNIWQDGSYIGMWAWAVSPGRNCLGGEVVGDDAWGLVQADARSVRVISTGQQAIRGAVGAEVLPGIRAWIGITPPGQVDRVEASDAQAQVLYTAAPPNMDSQPDTC